MAHIANTCSELPCYWAVHVVHKGACLLPFVHIQFSDCIYRLLSARKAQRKIIISVLHQSLETQWTGLGNHWDSYSSDILLEGNLCTDLGAEEFAFEKAVLVKQISAVTVCSDWHHDYGDTRGLIWKKCRDCVTAAALFLVSKSKKKVMSERLWGIVVRVLSWESLPSHETH